MRAISLLSTGYAWLALLLTLSVTLPAQHAAAQAPSVKVQLRASWSRFSLPSRGSPFLLELLEAARSQRPSSFFPLIDALTSRHSPAELRAASDEFLANAVEDVIKSHALFGASDTITKQELDAWRMALALQNSAPRVEAFAQLYKTMQLNEIWQTRTSDSPCDSWVHHQGQALCSAQELREAFGIDASQAELRQSHGAAFGHHRATSKPNKGDRPSVILYADPYSNNFRELFSTLEEYASHSAVPFTYTLRWRPALDVAGTPSQDEAAPVLAGYGAILDLKKVDYLVIDDRKLKDDSEVGDVGSSMDSHGEEEVAARNASDNLRWLQEQIGADTETEQNLGLSSLSEDQIADLGIKAARLIMSSSDPLRAMKELSQNFPTHAAALASSTKWDEDDASASLVEAVLGLSSMRIQPGSSELWLNGQNTNARDFMPLALLDILRSERRWSRALQHGLAGGGLNVTEAADLISSSLVGRAFLAQSEGSSAAATFDASDRIELKTAPEGSSTGAITWLNDLEKDEATSEWSDDLMDLLRPMWPGKFPRLSRNLFNVVLVLDLSQKDSCRFLVETAIQSLGRVGLHWGLVPGGLEDDANTDSIRMARLFWFVLQEAGPQLLSDVLRKASASKSGSADKIDVSVAVKEAKFVLKSLDADGSLATRFDAVLSGDGSNYTQREALTKAYIKRLRATRAESSTGHVFVNGQHHPFHPQIVHILHQAIQEQIQVLAPQIYYGQISSSTPGLDTLFYDAVGALSYRSALVPGSSSGPRAEKDSAADAKHESVDLFSALLDDTVPSAAATQAFQFFYPQAIAADSRTGEATGALLNSTVWMLADLDSHQGSTLLLRAFEALGRDKAPFRLGVLHTPTESLQKASNEHLLSTLLYRLIEEQRLDQLEAATMVGAIKHLQQLQEQEIPIRGMGELLDIVGLSPSDAQGHEERYDLAANQRAARRFWDSTGSIIASKYGLSSAAILVDGHLVSNFDVESIEARDVTALVDYEAGQKLPYIEQALKLLRENIDEMNPRERQDLMFAAVSVMNGVYEESRAGQGIFSAKGHSRSGLPEQLGTQDHVFEVGERATSDIRITLLVNPLSESAQRWSSILEMLSKLHGVYVRVILNPDIKLRELPLKRFYRFSAPHRPQFGPDARATAAELRFFDMPEEAVLTLGLDAPAPWLTMPVEAVYDLDNIRLADVPSTSRAKGVKAVYELKHILIEGHAREESAGTATSVPRGLQLLLETPDASTSLDTIVMANLAYFQFKAQPGLWKLRIRPGRSDELYQMQSVGGNGWNSASVDVTGEDVTLDTLSGLTIYPRVAKRAGKQREELLEELDAQGRPMKKVRFDGEGSEEGIAASASALLSSAKHKVASWASKVSNTNSKNLATRKHADINIFTVASGHLYERMTYIMILSVLKHTSSSVKFWFIENFLSPSFKEFIPHLAREYGFEYELVTYAWPHWLRAQREKQRTIWGYKILFLDTLFPLDLSKVIFVDADQVVRTDMKELVDLDLQGHVYGYPPMGDDSEDMDGFRFWKQGYWKDYLRGRPYHISALYVVDLNRFRLFAAGDRLRGQYQALSADPNSLSNLDQDLPNNMQASLPIFTLDKEWLWCETWCSNDWLHRAKTIDLCSNPKTKEPKLDRAKRQIPEWNVYDQEVAALAQRLVDQRIVGASVVAPDSQVSAHEPVSQESHHPHDEL